MVHALESRWRRCRAGGGRARDKEDERTDKSADGGGTGAKIPPRDRLIRSTVRNLVQLTAADLAHGMIL